MNTALWYTTRATGVVALVLLTITVVLGIAGVSKLESTRWPRLVTALLHKNISLLPAGTLRAVALTSTIAVPLATTTFAVTSLSGPRLTAALHRPGGGTEEVRLSLAIHGRRAFGRMLLQPGEASRGMNNDD